MKDNSRFNSPETKKVPQQSIQDVKGLPSKLRTKRESLKVLHLMKGQIDQQTALGKISELEESDPFKVLISTILSARTRDSVTEAAHDKLFTRFRDSKMLSLARKRDVEKLIKPVNFYKTKASRIVQVAKIIEEKYGGEVPEDVDSLLELPGVGRKTANCVMVYGFKSPAIPVDVHVHRISNRIGVVSTRNPEETEIELSKRYEKKFWLDVNEIFVRFGQTICIPTVPRCGICEVQPLCNYYHSIVRNQNRLGSA